MVAVDSRRAGITLAPPALAGAGMEITRIRRLSTAWQDRIAIAYRQNRRSRSVGRFVSWVDSRVDRGV